MTRTINQIKYSGMAFKGFTKSAPDITGIVCYKLWT